MSAAATAAGKRRRLCLCVLCDAAEMWRKQNYSYVMLARCDLTTILICRKYFVYTVPEISELLESQTKRRVVQ